MRNHTVTHNGVGVFCEHFKLLDECQLEVTRDLVEFKWWSLEELGYYEVDDPKEQKKIYKACEEKAKKLTKQLENEQGRIWANVHESPKGGFFTGYCRAGELASIAVLEAGKYYKLNVDLTAGYDLGTNWSQCH